MSLIDPFGLGVLDAFDNFTSGVETAAVNTVSGFWYAVSHSDETVDNLANDAMHPILTTESIANGVQNTFAALGTGLGSGNYEKAGEAAFGVGMMLLPELKVAKLGEVGNVTRMYKAGDETVAAETTASQTYQIMDGVRMATAANLTGAITIDAEILDVNMVSQGVQQVPINSLLSPKEFIDLSGSGAYRWNRVLEGTQNGANLPPIQITPGSLGIPIRNVTIGQP